MSDPAPGSDKGKDLVPKVDPMLIPGIIGAELARHTAALDGVLQAFRRTRSITRSQVDTLRSATDAIHRVGIYSQQLSRLAGGRLRQSHERLSLDDLLRRVLADNDWRYYEQGLTIQHNLHTVDVILDPGLLVSLLDVAIDCAARHGQVINMFLTIRNWPEHGLLTIKSRPHVATAQPQELQEDSLEWVMLVQLSQSIGVIVEREQVGDQMQMTIEFPRTVRQLEGLTAVEVESGDPSTMGESRPLAGHRILLITADDRLRAEVRDICDTMRLVLDVTPTSKQAIRYCELDKPDMIMVDERLHDEQFDTLREDLLRYDVNFPCVEVAAGANVVEVASWMGDRMSRISRDALRGQLPSILAMELAKVF